MGCPQGRHGGVPLPLLWHSAAALASRSTGSEFGGELCPLAASNHCTGPDAHGGVAHGKSHGTAEVLARMSQGRVPPGKTRWDGEKRQGSTAGFGP